MNRVQLKASLAIWRRRLTYRQRKVDIKRGMAHKHKRGQRDIVTHEEAAAIRKWERLRDEAKHTVAVREKQLAAASVTLGMRALKVGLTQVGIMETGGNNRGLPLSRYIRSNGGTGPEAWCGDFVAFCYRLAGSKVVQRGWAAVRLLGFLTGMRIVSYENAQPGDIVAYKFDHTGMLKRKLGNGMIETVEGNTGASGAVSDSTTGGDGVYIKRRSTSLVARYVRVTR